MAEIIAQCKPDALLPNLGGQDRLNLSSQLEKPACSASTNVKIIGVRPTPSSAGGPAGLQGDNAHAGIDLRRSELAYSVEQAEKIAAGLGYPVVIRPAYTLGGTGGGLVVQRRGAARGGRTRIAAAWWGRSWSRNPCSAGRSSSSRSCATRRTR